MPFDPTAYLARIGLPGPPEASPDGLAALQQAQLASIAFENLDPLTGRLPDLAPEAIWRKLVDGRRGGYCFELNGLFGAALAAFGFAARPVLARVRMGAPQGGARTHLAWLVTLEGGDWLADCGFGGPGPRRPLPLRPGALDDGTLDDGRDRFRLRADAEELVLERAGAEGWFGLYGFDDVRPRPVDVEAANVVCARWERAPFGSTLMLSRQLEDGRVACRNREGRTERGGRSETWTLGSAAELGARLRQDFGIEAAEELVQAAWARLPPS
jgi:N-hydroxyarylamine O-acetyltransferase